jgi:hypothetical protein
VSPNTLEIRGGGSEVEAEVVSDQKDAGVEARS